MSQIINLPPSLNLGDVKQNALQDMSPSFQKLRAMNASYSPRDTITIAIPTGRRGDFLHGADSFISFKVIPNIVNGAANVLSLDGTDYSFFRNVRVRHGSNVLVNQRNSNRLWNALYDVQVSASERESNQVSLLQHSGSGPDANCNNMYGITFANTSAIPAGCGYNASFTLPCPLVGSLSEKAVPLGWMNTSQLYIEIDLEDANKVLTTRSGKNTYAGTAGAADQAVTITGYTISEVYYHAKITQIGGMYDDMLLKSLGETIVIPSVDYVGDEGIVNPSSNINQIFSFPYSSAKAFIWWMSNTQTSNGLASGNYYYSSITNRNCGALREFNLTLNGSNYPPTPIYASKGVDATHINGTIVFQELLRCFNLNSAIDKGGILSYPVYTLNTTNFADDVTTKRFIAGIDLDRSDCEGNRLYQGTNTVNSQVALNAVFDTAPTQSQTLYAFMMHDCAYVLQDGLLSVQK